MLKPAMIVKGMGCNEPRSPPFEVVLISLMFTSKTKLNFEVKKKTRVRGRIALHCKSYREAPTLIVTPLQSSKALRNPCRGELAKLTEHTCSVKARNNNDAKTLASSVVQVHKVCSVMSATVMILPHVHLR